MSTDQDFKWAFEDRTERSDFDNGPGTVLDSSNHSILFSPLNIGGTIFKNRIAVSPMCQYSSNDGFFNEHHLVHLGTFAKGGAALVFTEATAVAPEGRITHWDSGIWKDEHIKMLKKIVSFIHANKALAGIQLAHAGRKASTPPLFFQNKRLKAEEMWTPQGASAVPWNENSLIPHELTKDEIQQLIKAFGEAAIRAEKAGFDVIEIHGAHGYLISSFNSPISNKRTDEYGGDFEGRTRFCLEVVREVKKVWKKTLFVRLSCTDWYEGGWDIEQTVRLAQILKDEGVDLLDCSSGGNTPLQQIKEDPGYQVPFAERVKKSVMDFHVGAVGKITEAHQAEEIIANGKADIVLLARALLADPFWPLHAAKTLGVNVAWPLQYERAKH